MHTANKKSGVIESDAVVLFLRKLLQHFPP